MPDAFESRCREIRTQIARSRRRFDRHLHSLSGGWRQLAVRTLIGHRSGQLLLAAGALGLAWTRFGRRAGAGRAGQNAEHGGTGDWLNQVGRRLRVLARHYRRSRKRPRSEADNE